MEIRGNIISGKADKIPLLEMHISWSREEGQPFRAPNPLKCLPRIYSLHSFTEF